MIRESHPFLFYKSVRSLNCKENSDQTDN